MVTLAGYGVCRAPGERCDTASLLTEEANSEGMFMDGLTGLGASWMNR